MGATPREFESRILRHVASDAPPEVAITPIEPAPGPWPGWRLVAPALLALAATAIAVTQLLGPSAAEPPLGRDDNPATPPWHVTVHPSPWLVTALMVTAVVAGSMVLVLALTRRWRPGPARLLVAGALVAGALALLPPIGSADTLSYAAYGRMVTTGHDPYSTSPADLARTGDPVASAVEVPWRHAPSVYGPLATGEQAAASWLAGHDVALTVWLLQLVGAAAFVGAGLLLLRVARGDDDARRRAATLWLANPLLWLQLVAGAHIDAIAVVFVAAAVAVAGRSRIGAGALAGAAASVKAPAGVIWLGLAWAHRRSRRALAALAVGALAVVLPGYVAAGHGAFRQLSRASSLVSLATPWRPVLDATGASRRVIGALAVVVLVILAVALLRRAQPGPTAVVVSAGIALAYVLAAPYALPWYDALVWVLLPLTAASWRDGVLLAHTAVLSLAYIPGRAAAPLHGAVHAVTWGMRTHVAPALLTIVVLAVLVAARRLSRPATSAASG